MALAKTMKLKEYGTDLLTHTPGQDTNSSYNSVVKTRDNNNFKSSVFSPE